MPDSANLGHITRWCFGGGGNLRNGRLLAIEAGEIHDQTQRKYSEVCENIERNCSRFWTLLSRSKSLR